MRAAEWKKIVGPQLPRDECWAWLGTLSYLTSSSWVLVGLLGESSSFDRGEYLWSVRMPLFVPSNMVNLSWSSRVGGGAHKFYREDVEELEIAVRSASASLPDEEVILSAWCASPPSPNRLEQEVRAYAQVLRNEDLADAADVLARIAGGATTCDWESKLVQRVRCVRALLVDKGHDAAVGQLARWRDETCTALGLRMQP
jgi:hypothetical protein